MINDIITKLRCEIVLNNLNPEDRVARVELTNGSRVILEFENDKFNTVELYGTNMIVVNENFSDYKIERGHYANVGLDELFKLMSGVVKSYKILQM